MRKLQVKGIFFDAGNTLLKVHPSIGEVYSEVAASHGVHTPPHEIEASFKALWNRTSPLVNNEGHRLTYEKERDWWRFLVREVFGDEFETDAQFEKFFDELFDRFARSDCWRMFDDVLPVLSRLRDERFKLAVISNWDSRLPALCDQLRLSEYFEAFVVSAVVGYEKPHPQIFQLALDQTGLSAEDVLYIGDDPYLDYSGAKKSGMHALHLDRYHRFEHHADRIERLDQIFDRISRSPD